MIKHSELQFERDPASVTGFCLDYDGDLSENVVDETRPRLEEIQKRARELCVALHEEANKFRGFLYFENIDPVQ